MRQKLIWQGMQVIEKMERETGFEPATSSLGRRLSIGNKEHCVSSISFWRLRIACFSLCASVRPLTEHKRSTRIHGASKPDCHRNQLDEGHFGASLRLFFR